MSEHAYRTKWVIGYVGREDANGVRSGIRLEGGKGEGNGVGGGNGDVNVDGEEDGAGTRSVVESNEETQGGNEDGRQGTGLGRVEDIKICAGKPRRVVGIM